MANQKTDKKWVNGQLLRANPPKRTVPTVNSHGLFDRMSGLPQQKIYTQKEQSPFMSLFY
jgi:hypothetical protein